jgi:beta-glucosidase
MGAVSAEEDTLPSAREQAGQDQAGLEAIFRDAGQPTSRRVRALLRAMTLEEKVGQMTQISVQALMSSPGYPYGSGPLDPARIETVLGDAQVGSLLSGGGGAPEENTPRAWAEMTNTLQAEALERSRLGIPLIYGVDAVHGHNNVLGARLYPHNVGLAASGDRALVADLGRATAAQVRATGIHWNFAPVLDVGRDPRWGRFYETWGESVALTAELGTASVVAQQGEDLSAETAVAATAKHFAGYAAPATGDDREPALIPRRQFADVHLPPFEQAVGAGARTAMANSGSVNGIPVHASSELLTGVLRGDLGFEGVLVSDWEDLRRLQTVYQVAPTYADAIALAVNAGIDMAMEPLNAVEYTTLLTELVEEGRVPMARIDEAVGRILTLKFELGLFEDPFVDPDEAERIIAGADPELARRAARETMTLLSNDGTLPLAPDASVLVTGPSADSMRNQLGGWSIGWQGVPEGGPEPEGTTVLEGVAAAVTDPAQVTHLPAPTPDEAAAAAAAADVAVVVLGEEPYAEGFGDSDTLELPAAQQELLAAVQASGTPTVLVLMAGRPVVVPGALEGSAAALMAYLPGSEGGGAVADVLFGAHSPSGRLPFTWPREVGQLPLTYDAYVSTGYEPALPFGHGLSYTTFAYGALTAPQQVRPWETAAVSVEVTNTGDTPGAEVVHAYVTDWPAALPLAPLRELVGFERVDLAPGETRTVDLTLDLSRLARTGGDVWGEGEREVVPGTYTLTVGDQTATFTVPDA